MITSEITRAIIKVKENALNKNTHNLYFRIFENKVDIWFESVKIFSGEKISRTAFSGKWHYNGQWEIDVINLLKEKLNSVNEEIKARREQEKKILEKYGK